MNILITGSNGFVGSRLMWFLEEKGHNVWGIDKSEICLWKKHRNTIKGDISTLSIKFVLFLAKNLKDNHENTKD